MTQLVQIKHLRDYSRCPNYARYNWFNPEDKTDKTITKEIVESCYRDIFVLNKTVDWKTVRNRIHYSIAKSDLSPQKVYSQSVALMSGMRDWYINCYRDGPVEGIGPFTLTETILDQDVTVRIDGILNDNRIVTMIHYSNQESDFILNDIELRLKVLLLSKQNVKINKILILNCHDTGVRFKSIVIDNLDNWNFKTQNILSLMLYAIKNKVFYPSISAQCNECKFKTMCTW